MSTITEPQLHPDAMNPGSSTNDRDTTRRIGERNEEEGDDGAHRTPA